MDNYKIGFVRSPSKAYREEQEALLKEYGCNEIIIHEYGEDAEKSEKALNELTNKLRDNDQVVITSIDRLVYEVLPFARFLEKAEEKHVKLIFISKKDNQIIDEIIDLNNHLLKAAIYNLEVTVQYERTLIRQNLIKDGIIENGKIDKNKPKTTKKTKTIVS